MGVIFALVFVGLSPSINIYQPLWRIWGTLLGDFAVAIVFFILWPEYAGDSLLPRLQRVIGDTLELAPSGSASSVGFSRRVRPYNGKIFQRRRRLRRAPFDAAELATKFIGARSWQQCKVRMVDLTLASEDYPMGQGCCSWHGGECGCQNGRDQCCDGTLSPTCSCHNNGRAISRSRT